MKAVSAFRDRWETALGPLAVALLGIANSVLIAFDKRNAPALLPLAVIGVAALCLRRVRITSLYGVVLLLFCTYFFANQRLLSEHGVAAPRDFCYAALSGAAVYWAARKGHRVFTDYIPAVFLAASAGIVAVSLISEHTLFAGSRLQMWMGSPNEWALWAATTVICACSALLGPPPAAEAGAKRGLLELLASKPVLYVGCAAASAALVLSFSRAAVAACLLAVFLTWGQLLVRRRKAVLLLAGSVVAAALLLVGLARLGVVGTHVMEREAARMRSALVNPVQDATFKSRGPGWESAWDMFKAEPIFGCGVESFGPRHKSYVEAHRDRYERELGPGVVASDTMRLVHAHNQWLMLLAELGLAGTVLFAFLFLAPFAYAVKRGSLRSPFIPLLLFYLPVSFFESPLLSGGAVTPLIMLMGYTACLLAEKKSSLPS